MCVDTAVNAIYIARLKRFPAVFMIMFIFWGTTPSGLVSVSLSVFFLEYPEYWAADVFETMVNRPIYNSKQC
jgi:hypothetical protein